MTAQALQRTSTGEGLLINGDLPPVFFRQRRHYLDRGGCDSSRGTAHISPKGVIAVLR